MEKGERRQAIWISRGGRTTKIAALTDERGGPRAFHVTGSQVADCRAIEVLMARLSNGGLLIADRGYDTNHLRDAIAERGAAPNIPPKVNGRFKPPFSRGLYRERNAIERMFGRRKDFRADKRRRLGGVTSQFRTIETDTAGTL